MAVTRHRLVGVVLLACLGALATVLLPVASAGTSAADYAARMVVLVNQQRASHGLVSVTAAQGTSEVADGWAGQMMSRQALSHNPDLRAQLESHGSPDWHTYGEVVGRGPADDPDAVFAGYMQSSEHRSVILDPAMRFVGVGVRDDGAAAWNVLDFVDTYGSASASSAPAPAAPASTAPAPARSQAAVPTATAQAPGRPVTSAPNRPVAAAPGALAITAVGWPVRQPTPSTGLRGWVTAVPLQHHNRALPVALLAAGSTGDRLVLNLIGPLPSSHARPAAPVVVAAALVGIVAVGLLVVVVGAADPGRLVSARGSRSRVASRHW